MVKGQIYQLAPGEDGIYGNEDDEKDGWILVQSLITGESGFVPIDYVQKIVPSAVATTPLFGSSSEVNKANKSGGGGVPYHFKSWLPRRPWMSFLLPLQGGGTRA